MGEQALKAMNRAMRSKTQVDSDGFKLEASTDSLWCTYENLDSESARNLQSSLSWISLLMRLPRKDLVCISEGHWHGDNFILHPLRPVPVDWTKTCWRQLFRHVIIANCEGSIPLHPLLKAPLQILYSATGVITPVEVGDTDGLILHGVFSALIAIEQTPDGSILWHIEMKLNHDSPLRTSEIECLKQKWLESSNLEFLEEKPALLG